MKYSSTMLVGQIAVESKEATKVFDDFGINYGTKGKMTLWAACSDAGVELQEVLRALDKTGISTDKHSPAPVSNPQETTQELVAHITKKHHVYTKSHLELLERLINAASSQNIPRHAQMRVVFARLSELFRSHMQWEETVIFPYLVQADAAFREGQPVPKLFEDPNYATNPLRRVLAEHKMMEKEFIELLEMASDLRKDDPLLKALQELSQDNKEHIRLENSALLKRAVQQGLMS